MCGISMILDFEKNAHSEHIQQMMDAIKHRGPDSSNILEKGVGKGQVLLGSNRLKIIDTNELSNQPFISPNGRYALIFNGEIYNYENLKNQLISSGVQFTTASDTEVLLHWLIQKGEKGISMLNGMFALIFADFKEGNFLIARDFLGIKPLFVHTCKNNLVFSSEIAGILASGLVPKQLNDAVIPHYLAYKYAPKPATFLKDIEEFLPGIIWQIDTQGNIVKSTFQPQVSCEKVSIKQHLIDGVIQQYSQNNNAGVMLSGGVDSTLLLAILNKELGYRNIPVYSVASVDKNKFATQDGSFAPKAAKLYQAEYNEIKIDESSLILIDEYVKTLGQPIADSGGFLTWLIAKKASGKSKVLLSGAGADEFFAGYNRYLAFYNYLKQKDKPWFQLLKRGKRIPTFSLFMNNFKKIVNAIDLDASTTFNNFIQSDSFRQTGNLWDTALSREQHLRNALTHDQINYLSADVLAITDRATMQYSIETRVPYLDNSIVQATKNIPTEALFKHRGKWVLKEQLINYGGKMFVNRKKQGLGLPMHNWLKADCLWEFNIKENLIHQFVSKQKICELRKAHSLGKENLTQELWRILLLHKWLEMKFS